MPTPELPMAIRLAPVSTQFLPEEIARGADGAMTGLAYPEMLAQVVDLVRAGEMDRAQDFLTSI